jgi:hypothetical protein
VNDHKLLGRLASFTWLAVFLIVYLPAIGHGFIKDDFGWILNNRVERLSDLKAVVWGGNGFFRPVVAATFSINAWMFGNRPFGYGLTNLLLALLGGWGVYRLAIAIGLRRGAATLSCAVWLLNIHGIYWGLLWISGRTSLISTAAVVFAAECAVRGRALRAALLFAIAIFAKEEVFFISLVLVAWALMINPRPDKGRRDVLVLAVGVACVTAIYLWLRHLSGAVTPQTVSADYRFTFDPGHLWTNVTEYADRAASPSIAVALIAALVLGWPRAGIKERTRVLVSCAIWAAAGFALTVFLPVRSDLYAILPSVGVCLAAAVWAEAAWAIAPPKRRTIALAAAIVVPVLLIPVYMKRNVRWTAPAEFSSSVLTELDAATRAEPLTSQVAIRERRDDRVNLASSVGEDLRLPFFLWSGRHLEIAVSSEEGTQTLPPCNGCRVLSFRIQNRHLVREK